MTRDELIDDLEKEGFEYRVENTPVKKIEITDAFWAGLYHFTPGMVLDVICKSLRRSFRGYWCKTDKTKEGYVLVFSEECKPL